jgi:hypothetical protein
MHGILRGHEVEVRVTWDSEEPWRLVMVEFHDQGGAAVRGTVIKRGTRDSVVLDLGRGPDGKRIHKWHSAFKTKEAERAQIELLARLDQGAYIEPSKLTVAAFLRDHWLSSLGRRSGRARGPSITRRAKASTDRPLSCGAVGRDGEI